ncbi:MAG TPA: pyridoxamine 5'-phosphate oxidase family protein [Gemmatimonadaceae bacterium]
MNRTDSSSTGSSASPFDAGEPGAAPERLRIRVHADRAVPDEAGEILASGLVAHVGFTDEEGRVVVIPMSYHYDALDPAHLHVHGGRHSRLQRHLAGGAPVCVTVTLVDGLVYSRGALYHSMNYRSVVCFARAAAPRDLAARRALLERMIARYHPGRTPGRDYEGPTDAQLEATSMVSLAIEAWSAKARRGGATGPRDADPDAPGSAGVVPMTDVVARLGHA